MSRDLALLHPRLQAILPKIKAECEAQALPVLWTDGMRTRAEQDALYAQGRTAPGTIVTNVRYPDSLHNWGVAVDFCRNVKGREYDDADNFFFRVAFVAKAYGLDWGGDWTSFRDKPHLQLGEYSIDGTTDYLRRTYGTPDRFIATWKKPASGFLDVPDDRWSSEAVAWNAKHGIMAGYPDGLFDPTRPVTREELASVTYRLAAFLAPGKE